MTTKKISEFSRNLSVALLTAALASCGSGSSSSSSSSSSTSSASSSTSSTSSSTSSSSSSTSSSSSSSTSSSSSSSSSSSGTIPAGSTLVYAVNAGGAATTLNNVQYQADRFSTGGAAISTTDPIDGVSEDTLYQSERYGAYKYEIPVTNSTYSLKLHFAELYHSVGGARLFNVTVEGEPVIQSMDLYEEAGHDTALDVVVTDLMVADESLTIELTTEIDNATISGFAIYSNDGGKFVQPTEPEGCDLPSNLSWTSSQAIISPRSGFANLKDPTIVWHDNKYHVFATAYSNSASAYQSVYMNFSSFDQAGSAQQTTFAPGGSTVAPQVFYFRPQNRWYIITQWPAKYTTSTNISDPSSWTSIKPFWSGVNGGHAGALDYWVICDSTNCYMFFFKDDGKMYQVKTAIGNFPNFDINQVTVSNVQNSGGQNILFEAGNVYKIKGQDKYLLQVEGWGASEGRRLYRSWTSTTLEGPWIAHKTSENDPFAGLNNVSFPGGQWSQQISHGEMIRAGSDETMELDACNMQFLYQGVNLSGYNGSYDARPYRLGLLTQQ